MKILDIDLSFFLHEIHECNDEFGERIADEKSEPWDIKDVNQFFSKNCNLKTNNKISGDFFTYHSEVFSFWRTLIEKNILTIPFEVVHIDAYSDMGMFDYRDIFGNTLHKNIVDRYYTSGRNSSNYLIYAIACRWISKVTFVLHPNWQYDLQPMYMKNFDGNSDFIQLKKCNPDKINGFNYKETEILDYEPEVPFELVRIENYKETDLIDFMTICQSPSSTPESADKIFAEIKKYITKIKI